MHPRNILTVLAAVLLLSACAGHKSWWASQEAWYMQETGEAPMGVDVFYIASTQVLSETDGNGNETYQVFLTPEERDFFTKEYNYAKEMFTDSLNFYAPYYHQYTLESLNLDKASRSEILKKVSDEVNDAFDYYMKHFNGGRPFILAGFSQGGMLVVELLKHMSDKEYSRMVAAYSIGNQIRQEDLSHPHIIPADGPDSWGQTISFNTVTTTESIWDAVAGEAVTCINPVNWRTDDTPATFSYREDSITVHVDQDCHVLIAEGIEDSEYIFEPLSGFCKPGNLHHWDIKFYKDFISRNALHRAYSK